MVIKLDREAVGEIQGKLFEAQRLVHAALAILNEAPDSAEQDSSTNLAMGVCDAADDKIEETLKILDSARPKAPTDAKASDETGQPRKRH
jgi:hypothetical protein